MRYLKILMIPVLISFYFIQFPKSYNLNLIIRCGLLIITLLFIFYHRRAKDKVDKIALWSMSFLLLSILWNFVFRWYTHVYSPKGCIFRGVFYNLYSPLYGYPEIVINPFGFTGILAFFLVLFYLSTPEIREKIKRGDILFPLGFIITSHILIITLINYFDDGHKFGIYLSHQKAFAMYVEKFSSVREFLKKYVDFMPIGSVEQKHYPPGNTLLFLIERLYLFRGAVKVLFLLCVYLTLFPLYIILKVQNIDNENIFYILTSYLFCTGINIYPLISTTSVQLFLGSLGLMSYFLWSKSYNYRWAIMLGIIIGLYALFSFGVILLIGLISILSILEIIKKRDCLIEFIKLLGLVGITIVFFYEVFYLTSDFDILRCYYQARKILSKQLGPYPEDFVGYILRSTGNIFAFIWGVGIPIFSLFISEIKDEKNNVDYYNLGVLLWVMLIGFSGIYHMETARSWLFLYLPVVIGTWRGRLQERYRAFLVVVIWQFIILFFQVYTFDPYV